MAAAVVAALFASAPAVAQAPQAGTQATAPRPGAAAVAAASPTREGLAWQSLTPDQREVLKPLQGDWSSIEPARQQKWIGLAGRVPGMSADERARVQARMTEWARMTPAQRTQARLRYQEARQMPSSDRRARWEAYQALTPDQKNELTARAAAERAANQRRAAAAGPRMERSDKAARDMPQTKSNIVTNPALATPPRTISATVMQASPGATTTLITRRPSPPPHQQTGMPKIAATPEFVDKSTLLPQRGAQGAAIRLAPRAADAASAPRR